MGGNFHLKLNISSKPIANKYHEGKMKRTLKRELKVPEIAEREANGTSFVCETDVCIKRMLILASPVIGSLYSKTTLSSWTLSHAQREHSQQNSMANWMWYWD